MLSFLVLTNSSILDINTYPCKDSCFAILYGYIFYIYIYKIFVAIYIHNFLTEYMY